MIRQVNILVILIALSTTLGIENDKFTRTLNSIEELLKTKIKLLNDLDKQFHNKDITMIPFRCVIHSLISQFLVNIITIKINFK